jgi:hypothetical protein
VAGIDSAVLLPMNWLGIVNHVCPWLVRAGGLPAAAPQLLVYTQCLPSRLQLTRLTRADVADADAITQ